MRGIQATKKIIRRGYNLTEDEDNVQSYCHQIEFTNQGTSDATLTYDNISRTIEPGQSVGFGSDRAEVVEGTRFAVSFGAGTNNLIVEKIYIEDYCE